MKKVIREVIKEKYLNGNKKFNIKKCGMFVVGGNKSDDGLNGRKIIVDKYGGWGENGGGEFYGKDLKKVDSYDEYDDRWVEKYLVKEGI
jgi:S-adenosylmethionine synthetase